MDYRSRNDEEHIQKFMQSKKLTPLEILQEQKKGLQAKSNELSGAIENRFKYMQQNFVPLLRDSVMESAVSKMPSNLQNLAGNLLHKEKKTATQDSSGHKIAKGITLGIMEIAPFFLKGKKGALISFLLKQIVKRIAR